MGRGQLVTCHNDTHDADLGGGALEVSPGRDCGLVGRGAAVKARQGGAGSCNIEKT